MYADGQELAVGIARTRPTAAVGICLAVGVEPCSGSATLRAAAGSEDVWGSFLPADWADVLARYSTAGRREGETKKELFSRLCGSPVLLDGCNLVIFAVADLIVSSTIRKIDHE